MKRLMNTMGDVAWLIAIFTVIGACLRRVVRGRDGIETGEPMGDPRQVGKGRAWILKIQLRRLEAAHGLLSLLSVLCV